MVYLFYGDDTFTIEETVSSMKQQVNPPDLRDFNIAVFEGAEISLDELAATCNTVPFLAEKRVVIVQGLLSIFERRAPSASRDRSAPDHGPAMDRWKGLAECVARLPETTELVFVDGRLNARNPLLTAIRPHATVRTFPQPRSGELRGWIGKRAMAEGVEIEPRAIDTLAETVGGDLRVMASELQKLALYRWGETIRHSDVVELVSYTREANIFEAVDAMMEGRANVAISLVNQLMEAGRPAVYILAMVARQVRLLILAKDLKARRVPQAEMGSRLGLGGYPLRKTLQQADQVGAAWLVELHRRLLEADLGIKSTGSDEELVLDVLIAESAARRPRRSTTSAAGRR